MNKKVLFAVALPLFLSACNNELENVASVEQTNSEEIVGAKLVGNGLTIEVNRGEVESRMENGDWVKGDELGLAWYRAVGASSIFADQVSPTFNWLSYKGKADADHKIYGNHKFSYDGSVWATQSNVYEGFHFAYYPYAYMKKVDQIVITPNAEPQKADFDYESNNKTFWISAQDTVLATAVTEEGTVSKKLDMVRAVNVLKFNITPNAPFSSAAALKDLNITGVEIQTGGADPMFYTTANIQPSFLPYAVYVDENEDGVYEYKSELTKAKVNEGIYGTTNNKAFKLSGATPSMKTTIDAEAGITLGEKQSVRMFLLPTKEVSLVEGGIAIYVYVPGGYFRIDSTDATENNAKALNNLRALLSAEGLSGYKLSKLQYANLPVNIELVKGDFTPDFTSISNIDEWNGAVAIANALEIVNPTFVVDGEVCITNGKPFELPANGVTINTTPAGKICVENDYTIPAVIAAGLSADDKVEVKSGATLTIEDNVTVDAAITNKGIIEVGYKAVAKTVANEQGRINVIYGSYVEITGTPGIIAYNVTGSDKAYQINYLTAATNILGAAHVNTLVVGNGITFDLSMVDHDNVFEDPYNGSVAHGKTLERMNEMKFELCDGTIVANANSGVSVKNVEVVGGESNEIWNINVDENLTITEGKVTVDAAYVGTYKESLKVKGTIDNKAELVANVDIYTSNISNPAGAKTTVNAGYTIWYTNTYTQGGTASGYITKLADLPGVFETIELPASEFTPGTTPEVGKANWSTLINKIKAAPNGATIILPAVHYQPESANVENYFQTNKSFTLVGTSGTTIKTHSKGIKIQSGDSKLVITFKNLTIDCNGGIGLFARGSNIINLQNVVFTNCGPMPILVDNLSDNVNGLKTVINAYNVTVPATAEIALQALHEGYNGWNKKSYIYFNYEGGNISDSMIKPQSNSVHAVSTGDNMFINGVALPASL